MRTIKLDCVVPVDLRLVTGLVDKAMQMTSLWKHIGAHAWGNSVRFSRTVSLTIVCNHAELLSEPVLQPDLLSSLHHVVHALHLCQSGPGRAWNAFEQGVWWGSSLRSVRR